MRAARHLAAEMDLWQLVWQQVETFTDRIDSARDQDADNATRFAALMTIAGIVERERALREDDEPLGDPVVDAAPMPDLTTGWQSDHRIWRIPGTDEIELAVANLYEVPGEGDDRVVLLPPSDFFSYPVEPDDPKYPLSDNGTITVRAPSYPGRGDSTIAGVAAPAIPTGSDPGVVLRALTPALKEESASAWSALLAFLPGVADEGTLVSLFPPNNRGHAARDVDQTGVWVLPWSGLTANRRGNRRGAAEGDVNYYSTGTADVPWTSASAAAALALAGAAESNVPLAGGASGSTTARELAEAAEAAAAAIIADSDRLREAVEALDEVGIQDTDLPGILEAAADSYGARPLLFSAVAAAARTLEGHLGTDLGLPVSSEVQTARDAAAATLTGAVNALTGALAAEIELFKKVVEESPIQPEADQAASERIAYPDGSLRILRALEEAFVRFWPGRIRWFRDRLTPGLTVRFLLFRAPFMTGLRALVHGGDTGLPADGLSLLTPAPTRTTVLTLDQPASLAAVLGDLEAGHVGLFLGGREGAALILGLNRREGHLALDIAPLRVSTQPAAGALEGDSPGLITAGRRLETFMPGAGLSTTALKLGEHPTEPAQDGIVEAAVILYGQLALLFGWAEVERGLGDASPSYTTRDLPDPSDAPAESLSFYGTVPAYATTLILRGAGSEFWDRSDPGEPNPLFARPGEILLLRGQAERDGAPGPVRQAAVQVESAYRTTVKAFNRMDATGAALLSTTPLPTGDIDACLADCEPMEDLIVLSLARSWQRRPLVAETSLRRDFAGFDLPSLATGRLLPETVVEVVTGAAPPGPADVDRSDEFSAAMTVLTDWLRFARR